MTENPYSDVETAKNTNLTLVFEQYNTSSSGSLLHILQQGKFSITLNNKEKLSAEIVALESPEDNQDNQARLTLLYDTKDEKNNSFGLVEVFVECDKQPKAVTNIKFNISNHTFEEQKINNFIENQIKNATFFGLKTPDNFEAGIQRFLKDL